MIPQFVITVFAINPSKYYKIPQTLFKLVILSCKKTALNLSIKDCHL